MIRRDMPWGSLAPESWLLIAQTDHARLSLRLAEAWGGDAVPPLVCPPDLPDHPLAATRREFLEAVDHHDEGWQEWDSSPGIDPASGRPYSFTEMPVPDVQRIWDESIAACRRHGLLAGWVAAAHFSKLQSKRDGDYPEWVDWLSRVDQQREVWLRQWLQQSPAHTKELADRCLAWLQALDWISLWLCCRCPVLTRDADIDPLTIGGDATGWPEIVFTPDGTLRRNGEGLLRVAPWPFVEAGVRIDVKALSIPIDDFRSKQSNGSADFPDVIQHSQPARLAWQLQAS